MGVKGVRYGKALTPALALKEQGRPIAAFHSSS